jgi:DNA-binding NarL/FixJ family response regulator
MQGRVLIADDNPVVRKTLRQLLEDAGASEVIDAENGQSALSRAIEVRPDVVILDLAMPVMDGLSAAREISKARPEAAILMYTMHWSPQLDLEAKKSGVRMLVSKSEGNVLLAAVQELLGLRQSGPPCAEIESDRPPVRSPDPASTVPATPAEGSRGPSPAASGNQKSGAAETQATLSSHLLPRN